jgi:YD repeat-containing protein
MKKTICILLAVLLAAAILPIGALAADVVLSGQNLRVDGKAISCEKYNIDGSNYFKLRDIAVLLNGTGSQFSVGWDGEKKLISIVTGEAYEPNGSELDLSGGDKSATAARSTQTLTINGEERSDLSAFNIGGNNFFKLRDLGEALGFKVDYDGTSNTAIVISRIWSAPAEWLVEETIYNQNGAATSHDVVTYNEAGLLESYLSESEYRSDAYYTSYDELGRVTKRVYDSTYLVDGEPFEEHSTTEYEYDIWGQLVREVYQATGDVTSETTYTYDENGNLLVEMVTNNRGSSGYYYSYDDNGYQAGSVMTVDDEVQSTEEYVRDAEGNILRSQYTDETGKVVSVTENTYTDGRLTETIYTYDGDVSHYLYTYDENGNVIRSESEGAYGSSVTVSVYDEQGRLVQNEMSGDNYTGTTVWIYDGDHLVKWESISDDGSYTVEEYVYGGEGELLAVECSGTGYTRTETYTYDREASKKTCLIVYEYEGVG